MKQFFFIFEIVNLIEITLKLITKILLVHLQYIIFDKPLALQLKIFIINYKIHVIRTQRNTNKVFQPNETTFYIKACFIIFLEFNLKLKLTFQ